MSTVVTKHVQPQHAAARHSTRFFGAAHGGFEACRAMPQHQKFCFVYGD